MKAKKRKAPKSTPKKESRAIAEISDKELKKLQQELINSREKSILIEQDLRRMRDRLYFTKAFQGLKKNPPALDRPFLFRCAKCVGEFKHTARLAAIKHKVICPRCNEEHMLRIIPAAGEHRIKLPASIRLIRRL